MTYMQQYKTSVNDVKSLSLKRKLRQDIELQKLAVRREYAARTTFKICLYSKRLRLFTFAEE